MRHDLCHRRCPQASLASQRPTRGGRGGEGRQTQKPGNAGSTRWPCRFTQHLWLKGLVMRDQQGGPCAGADRGRRQNGSEGAVLTGLPQVSPRHGWRVAGGQGGARRSEVHSDVGQVQKRYNIVLGPTQLNTIQQSLWQDFAKGLIMCTRVALCGHPALPLKHLPPKTLNTLNPP